VIDFISLVHREGAELLAELLVWVVTAAINESIVQKPNRLVSKLNEECRMVLSPRVMPVESRCKFDAAAGFAENAKIDQASLEVLYPCFAGVVRFPPCCGVNYRSIINSA
jgi:hypothetical protein